MQSVLGLWVSSLIHSLQSIKTAHPRLLIHSQGDYENGHCLVLARHQAREYCIANAQQIIYGLRSTAPTPLLELGVLLFPSPYPSLWPEQRHRPATTS